jgi:DNA-binding XRE family transcriptional regulator
MVKLVKYEDVGRRLLADPKVKAEYDALEDEFRILGLLLDVRRAAGVTQAQIAEKMKTQKSNISRLENGKTDPKLSTLFSYARALGVEIEMTVK